MKLPNGYGTVYRLSGNRRNPFIARKTIGWEIDVASGKVHQKYRVVGYYPTKKEALAALADFNADPYDPDTAALTFEDVYLRWSTEHYSEISAANARGYRSVWSIMEKLCGMRFVDVRLDHLQDAVDRSGKNAPTLRKLKSMLSLMYKYAVAHGIISKERDIVAYLNVSRAGNPNALLRTPFSTEEIRRLFEVSGSNCYFPVILILIYSGCRIGELLALRKDCVDLDRHCFRITHAKTAAGIRTVPIADKTFPFFRWWMAQPGEYLITTPEGKPFIYKNYYDSYWKPLMEVLGMEHRPHDTRHTCISMLASAGVDEKIIKKIVGHRGQGVTENVYTHFEVQELIDAINQI